MLLERRGLQPKELQRGQFYQLNLYTTDFYGLPDDLFTHPEINWHGQQLGQKGLIAAAGLWIRDAVATISTLQSDLCQQLYRHATLKRLCKTQVDTHFRYWYAILFNAIMDFCLDFRILTLRSPTAHQIIANTRKTVQPDLFCRIYNYPDKAFDCRKVTVADAQYWEIPVRANRGRLAPLAVTNGVSRGTAKARLCIFHDIEENVDTQISSTECAENLARMLQIEKSFCLDTTYDVLGMLFERKRDLIRASNPRHSIGFHSFNHNLRDLAQLPKCRSVDLRVRGYRPPKSRITSELTNYRLAQHNFEWFACSARSLGYFACRLESGIVRIPIHLDDHSLFMGKPYKQWECEVLEQARAIPYFGLGLHDCYAGKWLGRYADLLEKLLTMKEVVNADEICDSVFLDAPAQPTKRPWS